MSGSDPTNPRLERLERDILQTAGLAGVSADQEVIRRVLTAFADGFRDHPVETRTTTKSADKRGLSFRFVDLDTPRDPFKNAVDQGLLSPSGRPVDALIPELMAKFEVLGWGVDAEVSHGLEKIWPFFRAAYPLSILREVSSLPPSIHRVAPILEAHGMHHASIVAADFRNETANLYAMVSDPSLTSPDNLRALAQALGLDEGRPELLEYASRGVAVNVTLSWRHDGAERFCAYVPAPAPEHVPEFAAEPIPTLVAAAPFDSDNHAFIVGPTLTRRGSYIKLELDWSGTILGCLQRCTTVPLADAA